MAFIFSQLVDRLDKAKAFPAEDELDTVGKKALTNEAIEAVILSGRWNGTEQVIHVTVGNTGIMTLPRQFLTAKGVKVNGIVRDMASPWYSYLQGTTDSTQWSQNIVDQGDGFCTFQDPNTVSGVIQPVKIQLTSSQTENATVHVNAKDQNGQEIFAADGTRGIDINIVNGTSPLTTQQFTVFESIVLPVTLGHITLTATYLDLTTQILGVYDPGETVPNYRRYFVAEAVTTDPNTTFGQPSDTVPVAIDALCQLRHVDLTDNDKVPIANLRAMKNAVAHVHWENAGDETRSQNHLDLAVKYLNDELKRLRPPSEVGAMRVNARCCGARGLYSRY